MSSLSELSSVPEVNIAAASYEGSLFSWSSSSSSDSSRHPYELTMTSGFHCCAGSLRAVAVSKTGKYLVCGGTDERIRIFNMRTYSSLGELSAHTGAITCLEFFEDSYLLSGSEDCSVCIWRVHDWLCVHILGGHKAAVTSLSIHPSGKLALSTGKDNTLRLWNLVQGRCAFTRRLKGSAASIPGGLKWERPDAANYMIVTGNRIEVFSAADNSLTTSFQYSSRVNEADFLPSSVSTLSGAVVAVCEDKTLQVCGSDGQRLQKVDLSGLGGRLRSFSCCHQGSTNKDFAAVVTSNGKIALLNMRPLSESSQSVQLNDILLASHSVKVEPRLTCTVCWIQSGSKGSSGDTESTIPAEEGTTNATHKRKRKGKSSVETERASQPRVRFQEDVDSSETKKSVKKRKPKQRVHR